MEAGKEEAAGRGGEKTSRTGERTKKGRGAGGILSIKVLSVSRGEWRDLSGGWGEESTVLILVTVL